MIATRLGAIAGCASSPFPLLRRAVAVEPNSGRATVRRIFQRRCSSNESNSEESEHLYESNGGGQLMVVEPRWNQAMRVDETKHYM